MRITFPAQYCENYSLSIDESELIQVIEATFKQLNWQHYLTSNNEIQARVSMNIWSFGEKITVRLQKEGVSICSECVYPLQCFDWGKNKENVGKFLNHFEKIKRNLLADKISQTVKAFDEKGLSPVERAFAESE